ncbi:hypothetical protein MFM001_00670 [Mycobacterium sp. MFM001]|uniref:hypothetical protein n=1 Tax=Mycobacterium sp. MFM001 TaxID=2049453 RepID=UPI000DA4FAE9|nr:hypothetical protein [Mycobacterium sp. MFM001]GBE63605.1 hypothetical protein MFM001_00670 [Mycobacterium sp. MFM001]
MTPELRASPTGYAAAAAANTPPPPIPPTGIPDPGSIVDNLLATLGTAANLGVPSDFADAQAGQEERDLKATDAAAKFPANEQDSASQLAALPQLASGLAGAVAGALGGVLQPLSQAPQQAAQQAMQMGMSGLQGNAAMDSDIAPEEVFDGLNELPSGGGGLDSSGFGATVPTAVLGPPPAPSAGTFPASSPTVPVAPVPSEPSAPRSGTGAVPMMPPAAMPGARGAPNDLKPDTKRVVVPTVRNGAPVQGRITTPLPEVTKRVAGKPITGDER